MILITGGAYQGKSAFAKKLAAQNRSDEEHSLPDEENQQKVRIVEDIHKIIAEALREGRDPYAEIETRVHSVPDAIVTVQELGCGIVPIDPFDREWREVTGRISCRLANEASAVYRMVCGIPQRLK